MTVEVLAVDPRTDPAWRQLSRGPGGSLFTSPPWISAVCETYGFHPTARVARDADGVLLGGFAWVDVDDLRGRRRVALPFGDRAEPILIGDHRSRSAVWRALCVDALADGTPFSLRCLDGYEPADDRLVVDGEAAWHVTDLRRPAADLHARMRSSVRRNIATADRCGVEVTLDDGPGAVHELHRLHRGLRKSKYRLLAQPSSFFDNIWKRFSPDGSVWTGLARLDGRPIAAALYLEWAGTLYYKFGASDPSALTARPNDALHWAAVRHGSGRGLTAFDWGVSDLDQPGLVGYKRKWDTTESRVRTLRGGAPRFPGPADALLGDLTALLTDPATPDSVTEAAGDLLYRLFC